MAVSPSGDVFLSEPATGNIILLRDTSGDGEADLSSIFASGFSRPHGMVLRDGYLYVADVRTLWRIPFKDGELKGGKPERISRIDEADKAGGTARDLAINSAGRIYLGFGSQTKADRRSIDGTIQEVGLDGRMSTYATGLQTVAGMAFYPGTDKLFVTGYIRNAANGSPISDYLTSAKFGADYGSPGFERQSAEVAKLDLGFKARTTPLELVFYNGAQFPLEFKGDAFVALHGAWGTSGASGYTVARVKFQDGKPTGDYEDFVTGFSSTERGPELWGRPSGLAVARDGSLLITDDVGRTVWRVTYAGSR